jgi:hypothetical protein
MTEPCREASWSKLSDPIRASAVHIRNGESLRSISNRIMASHSKNIGESARHRGVSRGNRRFDGIRGACSSSCDDDTG